MSRPPVAAWLPPALRETPDGEPDAPRLLDLLLAGVEEQRLLLEQDIDAVWEDFFIESCADWAVPHIGALLGLPLDAGRSEVAYAVALRRRKGTPAALEDFAEVLTGWTVRALEGWQITLWAQRLRHPPPLRPASVDLRDGSRFRIGTPFERVRRRLTHIREGISKVRHEPGNGRRNGAATLGNSQPRQRGGREDPSLGILG